MLDEQTWNHLLKTIKGKIMAPKQEEQEQVWYSTGCDVLDCNVGGGVGLGFPGGKVINIVGDSSSGKTLLAWEIIASAVHRYKGKLKKILNDAEYGNTFDPELMYGIKMAEDEIIHSRTVEDMFCHYKLWLEELQPDDVGIYIVDSLDGLTSEENEKRAEDRVKVYSGTKKKMEGSYQMGAAKFLSQEFFKGVTEATSKKNVLLIIISQTRQNIDPFSFEDKVRSGGEALNFYAHTCLWLANIKKFKKKELVYGVYVRAKTKKSKTPRPYRVSEFPILFDYGIDNIGANVDFLWELRTETGDLAKDKMCLWNGIEPTVANLTAIIKESDTWEAFTKAYGKSAAKKSDLSAFIDKDPDAKKLYDKKIGKALTRDEMIKWVEENNKQKELSNKVFMKWESLEAEVKSDRKAKYGN